ncbi:MAG: deoxyguanosinetriphosphate triphosphohydrolase [Lachnospiraceae bacterium]|nr:deoxyguanosinetriphosphate triphosphohydrolase [Lachnospiraceae bacterium]
MHWSQILSTYRLGEDEDHLKNDLRSEFEKDYHRIIGSASFRRLQDKTQVFPLDKSDFIRTRLTHSLEVSSIGRSLAQNISESIIDRRLDTAFNLETERNMAAVIECAGLIHDIGNPPFGHFGEEAIREWFKGHLPRLKYKGRAVTDILSDQEREDLLHFEGNAQGLRLVSRLHYSENGCGMNLTFALLSTMIKYPRSSVEMNPRAKDVTDKKMGYYRAEEELFALIQEKTGTKGRRNPLTFILEAADDIAYATADIEDAYKKGFFDFQTFVAELWKRKVDPEFIEILDGHYTGSVQGKMAPAGNWGALGDYLMSRSRMDGTYGGKLKSHEADMSGSQVSSGESALMKWLGEMQSVLLVAATGGFVDNYRAIMSGTYSSELIGGREAVLLNALKGIAYDYAFTSMSIYKTEIAANNILTYLLNKLIPSVLQYDRDAPPGLMEEKFLSLISENYRQVYEWSTAGKSDWEKVYNRLLLATDTVSGMTDSYARDLYTDLNGITS